MELNAKKFDVNSLRTASPCSADWADMKGDERTRHCESCRLSVYNVAELTTKEVESLIVTREGRLCFRMFRRFDGTVVTRDCPVGLRGLRKRTAMFAGACLSAVIGLFSAAYGQTSQGPTSDEAEIKISREQADQTFLTGTITDVRGFGVANAEVVIRDTGDQIVNTLKADDKGYFGVSVPAGVYVIALKVPGYELVTIDNVEMIDNERAELSIKLMQDGSITMGYIVQLPAHPLPKNLLLLQPTSVKPKKVKKPKNE